MCGGEVICDKCVGPPTCECFVSSTDVQDEAGPSSAAGQPTISHEDSVHASHFEEVEEEHGPLEDEIYLGDETTIPGPSHISTSIGDIPPRASTIRGSPSSIREVPSRASPYSRPQASPAPRKATRKTRGDPETLEATLSRDQARQTHHVGSVASDMRRVADSLASLDQTQAASTLAVQQALNQQAAYTAQKVCRRSV